jgi:hypothetical protein
MQIGGGKAYRHAQNLLLLNRNSHCDGCIGVFLERKNEERTEGRFDGRSRMEEGEEKLCRVERNKFCADKVEDLGGRERKKNCGADLEGNTFSSRSESSRTHAKREIRVLGDGGHLELAPLVPVKGKLAERGTCHLPEKCHVRYLLVVSVQ